jgi:hypothetical protein
MQNLNKQTNYLNIIFTDGDGSVTIEGFMPKAIYKEYSQYIWVGSVILFQDVSKLAQHLHFYSFSILILNSIFFPRPLDVFCEIRRKEEQLRFKHTEGKLDTHLL